ncbi:MAG: hypothetical protein OJF49_004544 [Ktedonobacterales bacterium]|jgi:hypothetical protein|nr:MAG: hypothetical protein OJF49_004544 [Ktedonobacterales bacterium]
MAKRNRNLNANQQREQALREDTLDSITAQYTNEYHAGKSPNVEDYVRRYPDYAAELIEFALFFHAVTAHLPPVEETRASALSPAAQRVLANARQSASAPAAETRILSLARSARAVGLTMSKLGAAVGLNMAIVGKLDLRAITPGDIPRELVKRLAETLHAPEDAVSAYLGKPVQANAFFYADSPPQPGQESFASAIQSSMLAPDQKREWAEIIAREAAS